MALMRRWRSRPQHQKATSKGRELAICKDKDLRNG